MFTVPFLYYDEEMNPELLLMKLMKLPYGMNALTPHSHHEHSISLHHEIFHHQTLLDKAKLNQIKSFFQSTSILQPSIRVSIHV